MSCVLVDAKMTVKRQRRCSKLTSPPVSLCVHIGHVNRRYSSTGNGCWRI